MILVLTFVKIILKMTNNMTNTRALFPVNFFSPKTFVFDFFKKFLLFLFI